MEHQLPGETQHVAPVALIPGAVYLLRMTKYLPAVELQGLRDDLKAAGQRVSPTNPCHFVVLPPSIDRIECKDVPDWLNVLKRP